MDIEDFLSDNDGIMSDYDTSGDDFVPSSADSSDDEITTVTPKKKRKKQKSNPGTSRSLNLDEESADEDDNVPLSRLSTKRQLFDDTDDIPLAQLRATLEENDEEEIANIFSQPMWVEANFSEVNSDFKGTFEAPPEDGKLKTPIEFFQEIITDTMIEMVHEQTVLYSAQKYGVPINTLEKDIKIFIGLFLRMGLMQAHAVKSYWANDTRYPLVADHMARNKFQKLATYIHFTDNDKITEEGKANKLFKIQPWLTSLSNSLQTIPPEENSAVDEIMIPFKGRSSAKQLLRNKPHKWGFKMWGRAGASGILYEFEVYQGGSSNSSKEHSSLGMMGDVVMRMTQNIPDGQNFKVFADNLFTSLRLVESLMERSILYVGTVRMNRLKGCELKSETELKKEGGGSTDHKVEWNSGCNVVRWFDNRCVDLVSNYVGIEPKKDVNRYDKKAKAMIQVPFPQIVKTYNKFMGGIDLLDSLVALYKYPMKSKRWYMYIFYHTISFAVVNAWLCYRRHCKFLKNKAMKLSSFQAQVATSLVTGTPSVGRPCSISSPPPVDTRKRRIPLPGNRHDNVEHLPEWSKKRGRCKNSSCSSLTFVNARNVISTCASVKTGIAFQFSMASICKRHFLPDFENVSKTNAH